MSSSSDDYIRVVVGIDFGTTYSGFAFAHKSNPKEIIVQDYWKRQIGCVKTPTVIRYDDSLTVISWGLEALSKTPGRPLHTSSKPIELFKLYLLGSALIEKPFLPDELDYKGVIKDYLEKLGNDVRRRIVAHWYHLDFDNQVKIVLTVPAEFDDNAITIMRECAINANLIKKENSKNLVFTTEPEAAAIYSLDSLKTEYHLKSGDSFMVVDCGGGTVDLTTRELSADSKLIEITERTGDYCGSCCVDQEFIKFLGGKIGNSAIDFLKKDYYVNLQFIVQEFCCKVKTQFTGKEEGFMPFNLDFDYDYLLIKDQIVDIIDEEKKAELKGIEWLIEVKFEDVKKMFDPVIERIFTLIREQLNQLERHEKRSSIMLLVGGFSESEYLQDRIRNEFSEEVPNISVPKNPVSSVMKGAVKFGLSEEIVKSRILKWTYGTCVVRKWEGDDPLTQRLPNGHVKVFERLAERNKIIKKEHKVTRELKPYSLTQEKINFYMYVTRSPDAKYINDPEIKLLQKWEVKLPKLDDYEDIEDITILFTLKFSGVGISAIAENMNTGEEEHVTFKYDFDE